MFSVKGNLMFRFVVFDLEVCGGILDQIVDGYNGFLVQPRNPTEIAEKILWLISNPKEAKHMDMKGRKIIEEKFDIDKRIDRIISLYHRILEDRS